jgi:hypothetical protein
MLQVVGATNESASSSNTNTINHLGLAVKKRKRDDIQAEVIDLTTP